MSSRDRSHAPDRPVFCGNFEYDASAREIERLFERYGRLDRVEMKTGVVPISCLSVNETPQRHSNGSLRPGCFCSCLDPLQPHSLSTLSTWLCWPMPLPLPAATTCSARCTLRLHGRVHCKVHSPLPDYQSPTALCQLLPLSTWHPSSLSTCYLSTQALRLCT